MYTKTINKVIWDADKLNVGDLIACNLKGFRRHYNENIIKAFFQAIKFEIEEFNCVGFISEIKEDYLTMTTYDDEGGANYVVYAKETEIQVIHKNPYL